jgi:hypothetical protein
VATATEFQIVAPGLFHWQAYEPAVKCDLSACALVTPDGLLFVDPTPLADPALEKIAAEASLLAILLTNGNHERAADEYRRRFKIPVCATAVAASEMSITVDRILVEGEMAPGGMKVVGVPSAGAGEVALIGHGVACIGDALINLDGHGFTLLPAKYCVDAGLLLNDLRKLLSYDFRILTLAHGTPLTERPRQRLETLLV